MGCAMYLKNYKVDISPVIIIVILIINIGSLLSCLDHKVMFYFNSIIPTAFFATTLIFVCFTLSALWAEQRTYLYLGGESTVL